MNGTDLLTEFREGRSERAFSELVRRYTNLVYSVAKRRLSNDSLAQEVTQLVFIRLAKAAPKLRGDPELAAWLHRTTVYVSIDLWRSETRRRAREEHAVAMQPDLNENAAWNDMAPVLDEALNDLNDADRQAILLRFFDGKTMRDLGTAFGVSEDAAKMRVSRALDRLRAQLSSCGVTCTATALGAMLTERSVEAAPSQLVVALAAFSFPIPAGLGTAGSTFSLLLQVSKAKLVAGLAAMVFVGVGVFIFLRSQRAADQVPSAGGPQTAAAVAQQNQQAVSSQTQDTNDTHEAQAPDPLKLLQGVAQARQRITSGSIELQLAIEQSERGRKETNHLRLTAVFDGQKLRFESFRREYSYTAMGDASAAQEAQIQEQGLDKEGAVRAGLLNGFESHYVTAYDGAALLTYWENDRKPVNTTIDDPGKGSISVIFDPRVLGLTPSPSVTDTIESCLTVSRAGSVQLLGIESVEGAPAWHVRISPETGAVKRDFWIEASTPSRVVKQEFNGNTVISKYDATNLRDAIPTEVHAVNFYGMQRSRVERRFVRRSAEFNMPVDPATFTLAGLGMPVGTDVIDNRISRQIGYWTGSGLSEQLPRKTSAPQTSPDRSELLAVLESDPTSLAAFDAAKWILLNTPDGSDVEKAADVILNEHIRGTNLVELCLELERMRHSSSRKLLEAMMEKNPSLEVRGNACFTLATMRKDDAKYGENKEATAEAEKLFERIINDFGQVKRNGRKLADQAEPELSELCRLTIGKSAPEIEGENLDGERMRLSDHRGKVVVLTFWGGCGGCRPEAPELRKLLVRLAGKPLAVIGVYCDDDLDRAKEIVEKLEITWPSFRDGRSGLISANWNNRSWPHVWILDAQGVIRYRGMYGDLIGKSVDALLGE